MRAGLSIGAGAVLALVGCMATTLEDRTSPEAGAAFFAANCAGCHGADARGGVGPDLTLLSQRNGGTFPEIDTLATIYGPAYHQARGAIMPEFGRGDLGPTVVVELEDGIGTPVPADLVAVSAYLQGIQR